MEFSRQELFTVIFYFFGYSRIRNLIYRLKRRPVVRFLAFHDILPEASKQFRINLLFLKRRTNVISIADFLNGKLSFRNINVVITFDDGFKGWITQAIPLLKYLQLPATFFISSGLIGLRMNDATLYAHSKLRLPALSRSMTGLLSYEDVRMIVEQGFVIGGHTTNHVNLAAINLDEILKEIVEDKKNLELLLNREVCYFAYPFGIDHNSRIDLIQLLKTSGYKAAVTTTPGYNNASSNPFMLNRELTRAAMNSWLFRAIVYGNRDATLYLKNLAKTIRLKS